MNSIPESHSLHSHLRILNRDNHQYLQYLIQENPTYFLDELLDLLKTNRFVSLHYTMIHEELKQLGVSQTKLQRIAIEHNEDQRADFIRQMAQYSPEELGFIDEVSKDERTLGARRGHRTQKKQPFVCDHRTSTVGVLTLDGFACGMEVEGSLTKAVFLDWLEHSVVSCFTLSINISYSIL
jgi:hypothetical protein